MHSQNVDREALRRFSTQRGLRQICVLVAAALIFLSDATRSISSAEADTVLLGTVERIVDGDTLDVLLESGTIRVRLNAIDAPEKNQPGGAAATQHLSNRLLHKWIEVKPISQDRYGRIVAVVFENGENINSALVSNGYAWAYRKYMRKSDAALCNLEHQARVAHSGLWQQRSPPPIAPWEFRSKDKKRNPSVLGSETDCINTIGKRK